MKNRCWPVEGHPRPLILIDIAQPRDVEEGTASIDGVCLFSIDNLRTINEQTMSTRKAEAERAREFVETEVEIFLRHLNRKSADELLAALHMWADAVRIRERDRAVARIGNSEGKIAEIVDDLSRVLTKKLLTDATFSIRESAEEGDIAAAKAFVKAITRGDRIGSELCRKE